MIAAMRRFGVVRPVQSWPRALSSSIFSAWGLHASLCFRDESVPTARQRLNEAREWRLEVSQSLADLIKRRPQASFEIHDRASRPKLGLAPLEAAHDFTRALQQGHQQPEWQFLKLEFEAAPAQLSGLQIGFEGTKADYFDLAGPCRMKATNWCSPATGITRHPAAICLRIDSATLPAVNAANYPADHQIQPLSRLTRIEGELNSDSSTWAAERNIHQSE